MSFNNVLPWWVFSVSYEQYLAKCACAFNDEWFGGYSKEMPDHVIKISKLFKEETNNENNSATD